MSRPAYIYQGGSVLMHTPLQLKQSHMYGFFIKGDLSKLKATVDSTLNTVASGKMRFKPLSPYVMLTFTRASHANSSVEVDENKGWITEADIVTWIMVGAMDENDKLSHIYWYPFHIFVDDAMALINGREIFGYPKYDCQYHMPEPNDDPVQFSLAAKGFQPFSRDTPIAEHPLLEIEATNTGAPHRPIGSIADMIEQAITLFLSIPDFFDMNAEGWLDILSLLRKPGVDQIFLKQFPDTAGIQAVYQAIVAAPATINKLHSARLLGYKYQCTLHPFDSFPLDQTLGLKLGKQDVLLPFHVNFDFSAMPGEELVDNSSIAPEKIAILGGGVSAMTSAYHLTNQPGWQNKYDITLYQQGYRLGGKGASGRNPAMAQRIEEHGLHIWFGFYANAFNMIKHTYASLNRPQGSPLATWQDAFKQHDYIALSEKIGKNWRNWSIVFPTLPGEPGTGGTLTVVQLGDALLAWIKQWLLGVNSTYASDQAIMTKTALINGSIPDWLDQLTAGTGIPAADLSTDIQATFDLLAARFSGIIDDPSSQPQDTHLMLADALAGIRDWLHTGYGLTKSITDDIRRLLIAINLGTTVMKGLLADGVFIKGFDAINNIDFRAWLTKHGGDKELSVNSAPVRGFYDLVFAYPGADFNQPNVEAGTLLRAMMRIALAYKGGIMFKMQAGMGDTIFTPLYQLLLKRGVKFKFFHQVTELEPESDTISKIHLVEQVKLVTENNLYDPLVSVKGLDCWPSVPNYSQLDPVQASLLQQHNVNLESYWSDWPQIYQQQFGIPLPKVTLEYKKDFDKVIFGIPVGSLSALCPQLLSRSPQLKATSDKVLTVATQAYQLWLNKDLNQMGWTNQPKGQQPVLSAFTEPYDTWASMEQLIPHEEWPEELNLSSIAYFCSALPIASYPPASDTQFPLKCTALAKSNAINQLNTQISGLWPKAGTSGEFPWQWLVDPNQGNGSERFDSQYWRANVDPSERYVLSAVDSSKYRLNSDQSGFANLYLTGDWIKTGLNAGCVEAAVMAGMQTSRAISGYPEIIEGESDF